MSNQYKIFLDNYFSTLLDFIHTSRRLNKVLIAEVEMYTKPGSVYDANSALVLSDWTGETEGNSLFIQGYSKEQPKKIMELK